MIRVQAKHIATPLGNNLAENYQALLENRTALRPYDGDSSGGEPYTASKFPCQTVLEGYTIFESRVIEGIRITLQDISVDMSSPRTLLMLSTTKGNISLLETDPGNESVLLTCAAQHIADAFGMTAHPLVVSNACISGVSAQVTAMRLLQAGLYDTVVIAGSDVQGRFIISGFQSFKALSPEPCRPFDAERQGLNAGEAVAVMVLQNMPEEEINDGDWVLVQGAIRNDANHISGPSRTGEGSWLALRRTLEGIRTDGIAFVNAHGTATPYNDEMEAKAITRAGLQDLPVNGYKGYYGHTMGAAGLLETILSQEAIDHGTVIGTHGFRTSGVSLPLNLSADHRHTDRQAFVKLISGFGGCNAAVLWAVKRALPGLMSDKRAPLYSLPQLHEAAGIRLTDSSLSVNGEPLPYVSTGRDLLVNLYRERVGDYPKFYKMDALCRLGFIASEILCQQLPSPADGGSTAVILFSHTGSLCDDRHYQETLRPDNYFPSPAIFVYTLPNIVTGEICIRNKWSGESSMFLLHDKDWPRMESIVAASMTDGEASRVLCGWVDAPDEDHFEADLKFLTE